MSYHVKINKKYFYNNLIYIVWEKEIFSITISLTIISSILSLILLENMYDIK